MISFTDKWDKAEYTKRNNNRKLRSKTLTSKYNQSLSEDTPVLSEKLSIDAILQDSDEKAELKAKDSTLQQAFLANISHEIRTPMNAIIGFSELLDKKNLGQEEKEYVRLIKNAGEKLLTIIDDILDISKIETGSMAFEEDNFSVQDTLKSVEEKLKEKAEKRDNELSFFCNDNVPNVLLGDHVRLTQILLNLTGNAIKFTNNGKVRVNVKALNNENSSIIDQVRQGITLEFSINDTGVGIPKDKVVQIFEPFRQVELPSKRRFDGTGLGLTIAKELVELQGGDLSVISEVNVGSEFIFRITYKKSSLEKLPLKVIQKKYNMEELCKLKILLVEDNEFNIKLILSMFSICKLNAYVAENGKIGIEKLKEENFDIILMDMEMPVMNGYEATTIIRKELKIDIPIIAMTANTMAGEKEKCLQLGMNDYVPKPLDADLLYEKMYCAVSEHKKHQAIINEQYN